MINYDSLENAIRFNPGQAQRFTAIFANYSGQEQQVNLADIASYELTRIEVIYDLIVSRNKLSLTLKPRLISRVLSTADLSFNTVFVVDNGDDTTVTKNYLANWLTNDTAELTTSSPKKFYRDTIIYNNTSHSKCLLTETDRVSLQSSIGQPSTVSSLGRYLLATYKYNTTILVKANSVVKIKLGDVNINVINN